MLLLSSYVYEDELETNDMDTNANAILLKNYMWEEQSSIQPSWLIRFFHFIPHLDFSFRPVNATFSLDSSKYKESILAWSSIPLFVLFLVLNLLLVYFVSLYVCKKRREIENNNDLNLNSVQDRKCLSCLQWSLACFAIVTCGLSALGFCGEEETHKGISRLTDALDYVLYTSYATRNQLYIMEKSLNLTGRGVQGIKRVFRSHDELSLNLSSLLQLGADRSFQHNFEALKSLRVIMDVGANNRILAEENIAQMLAIAKNYEVFRRLIVVLFYVWCVVLSFMLLVGVARSSRCLLLLFCSFGIITVVFSWISVNVHLGVALSIADFCYQPEILIVDMLTIYMERHLAEYYLRCQSLQLSNPYRYEFQKTQNNIMESQSYIYKALQLAQPYISPKELGIHVRSVYKGLNGTYTCLSKLVALTDCTNLYKDYKDIITGICFIGLPGLSCIILSSLLLGAIFPILIVLTTILRRTFERVRQVSNSENTQLEPSHHVDFPSTHSCGNICMHYSGIPSLAEAGETLRESIA